MQRSLIQMTEVALPYNDSPSASVVPSIAAMFAAVRSFRVVPDPEIWPDSRHSSAIE